MFAFRFKDEPAYFLYYIQGHYEKHRLNEFPDIRGILVAPLTEESLHEMRKSIGTQIGFDKLEKVDIVIRDVVYYGKNISEEEFYLNSYPPDVHPKQSMNSFKYRQTFHIEVK